ncbi:MAG: beta-lactamase family protein [Rhodobacteraceae bacterium]|nr:beta-lactamase family protein [Alphaproteobacteria bacterium]MBT8475654.1 beta-lactamase family protein [Alphaproteobacteria bacterium]NNK66813.1 beta-lactamase family protein [Paracoccaceae bacterium]
MKAFLTILWVGSVVLIVFVGGSLVALQLSGLDIGVPGLGAGNDRDQALVVRSDEQVAETTAMVERVWREWASRNRLTAAAMAYGEAGEVRHTAAIGDYDRRPQAVMSLSKAITGICLNEVLKESDATWNTTIGDLSQDLTDARATPSPAAYPITLGQLVTHTSGLSPDLTQGKMAGRYHGNVGLHRRITWETLRGDGIKGNRGSYEYSNTNYAVLATVIEVLSGERYKDACTTRVMAPAGVTTAIVNGRRGSMSGYGGWEMQAADYARFAGHWFGPDSDYAKNPMAAPTHAIHQGVYGLGVEVYHRGRRQRIQHTGRLCSKTNARNRVGATFLVNASGRVFVATWNDCIDFARYRDLLNAVHDAMR